jgi:Asp/Glu/hydantoin racemase
MNEKSAGHRIVVINPNSSETVTQAIHQTLAPLRFGDGPKIDCLTLAEGPPGIETQDHIDAVIDPLCQVIRQEEHRADAFVVACFGDPGLRLARKVTKKPVFGIGESAYLFSLTLGARFGVIAILPASVERQKRYVRQLGLQERYAASLPLGLGVTALEGNGVLERIRAVGQELIEQHGAEVLILGCAGMATHREALEAALGVPVVEPSQAAVMKALGAVRFGYGPGTRFNSPR